MQERELDWYETPLYYDIIFDTDTQIEADFLEEAYRRYGADGKKSRRLLEPACGSGRLVLELARRGWKVTGLDLSDGMLRFARRRLKQAGVSANLKKADMANFDFPAANSFDLAHNLVSSFKYLLTEDDARSHLQCVARALRPGGLYVLGLHLSDYDDRDVGRERWKGERDGVFVDCVIEGDPPNRRRRRETVRSILTIRENGERFRARTEWTFRTYDDRQLAKLLRSVPEFEVAAIFDFHYRFDRPHTLDDDQLDTLLILRKL